MCVCLCVYKTEQNISNSKYGNKYIFVIQAYMFYINRDLFILNKLKNFSQHSFNFINCKIKLLYYLANKLHLIYLQLVHLANTNKNM